MKVLIALDESSVSLRGAREARRLFPHAEFLVLNVTRHVVPWVPAGPFGAVYPVTFNELAAAELTVDELAERADSAGVGDAEVISARGDPAHTICEAAESHDVDVVVVGSHDKGVLRRLLDPSVAQAVVQGTYRPVLVVSGAPPAGLTER